MTQHKKHPTYHSLCQINYNKTDKSRLKYNINYDLYEVGQK